MGRLAQPFCKRIYSNDRIVLKTSTVMPYLSFYEPQAWKPSRGVVCYVQSKRVNLSFSLIAQTDIQVLRENCNSHFEIYKYYYTNFNNFLMEILGYTSSVHIR